MLKILLYTEIKRVFTFASVGILNTVVGLSLIYLFRSVVGDEVLANIFGYSLSFILSYFLNGKLTFSAKVNCLKTFLKFLLAFLFSWSVNISVVLYCINHKFPPELSHLIGMPAFTFTFYLLSRYCVFTKQVVCNNYKKI
jgi:putative flippase GtrA